MTLTDAISGARSGHMNRILKYKILELVLMMKTVIGNWQSVACSGIEIT